MLPGSGCVGLPDFDPRLAAGDMPMTRSALTSVPGIGMAVLVRLIPKLMPTDDAERVKT
jgi:hypothetical protein